MLAKDAKSRLWDYVYRHYGDRRYLMAKIRKYGLIVAEGKSLPVRPTDKAVMTWGKDFLRQKVVNGDIWRAFQYYLDKERVEVVDLNLEAFFIVLKAFLRHNVFDKDFNVREDAWRRLHIARERDLCSYAPAQWGYRAASKLPGKMFK